MQDEQYLDSVHSKILIIENNFLDFLHIDQTDGKWEVCLCRLNSLIITFMAVSAMLTMGILNVFMKTHHPYFILPLIVMHGFKISYYSVYIYKK